MFYETHTVFESKIPTIGNEGPWYRKYPAVYYCLFFLFVVCPSFLAVAFLCVQSVWILIHEIVSNVAPKTENCLRNKLASTCLTRHTCHTCLIAFWAQLFVAISAVPVSVLACQQWPFSFIRFTNTYSSSIHRQIAVGKLNQYRSCRCVGQIAWSFCSFDSSKLNSHFPATLLSTSPPLWEVRYLVRSWPKCETIAYFGSNKLRMVRLVAASLRFALRCFALVQFGSFSRIALGSHSSSSRVACANEHFGILARLKYLHVACLARLGCSFFPSTFSTISALKFI